MFVRAVTPVTPVTQVFDNTI